ncbi:glycosyltransferase family 4 protein [Microlunatus capsulatus]|uniref:Glycosyltransferase involved in cell wall biosynthesis n=1 Tax=Microlunatus capsulatus TaxID=99117 RepID=A0ABS4Z546_9ACTN|nr:glycosyltransferase family 4 protein [Microlunatus capsulatus]MBP2415920.1 glycosyltransferase involved in cell wall biosynthesis [Microlunatus capsulatus]
MSAPDAGTGAGEPLVVTVVEFLPSGGMFQFSFQFAEALARAGHRVTLLTGPDPELRSDQPGLTVRELLPTWHPNAVVPGPRWRSRLRRVWRAVLLLESWRRVLVHLRRERPDVVQFGELRYALDTAALLVVARLGRARAVVDVAHNPLPYDVTSADQAVEKRGRLTGALLGRAYRACDLVLVLGEGPRSTLLEHFPGVRRTAVCGHGDYSSVMTGTDDVPAPSTAGPRALFFGAWTRYKDLPLLLEAFGLVRRELPAARLTLAGPVMPDVDLEAVRSQAERIGHVDLRPGYVPVADVPGLFAEHRVVLFTYATVNISGSIHMAYTFGRPVVATAVGSMADAVEDGVTGLLAAPDAPSVARAVAAVLGDDELADRLGAAAARRGATGASWDAVVERAEAGYRAALAAP